MKECESSARPSGAAGVGAEAAGATDPYSSGWREHLPNAVSVAAGRIMMVLGAVVGVRLLTEYVPPETFGRYKLALAGVSLVTGIAVRPFTQYAMRAWHDLPDDASQLRFVTDYGRRFGYLLCAVGVIVASLGALLAKDGGWFAPVDLVAAAAVLVLQAAVSYARSMLVTSARMRDAALIDAATGWLVPITIALSVTLGESLSLVLSVHACTLAGVLLVPVLWLWLRPSAEGHETARAELVGVSAAWKFAYPLMVSGCLHWLLHESDRFILGFYHDSYAVALYAAVYGLASAPFLAVAGAVTQFITPLVFGHAARGGTALVWRWALFVMLLICAVGVFLFWLVGDRVAQLALAEGYRETASDLMIWIAVGYACLGVATCFDLVAHGTRRTRYLALATGVAAVTNVGLGLLFVPRRGALGAAWATTAALAAYLLCIVLLVSGRKGTKGVGQKVLTGAARKFANRSERGGQG